MPVIKTPQTSEMKLKKSFGRKVSLELRPSIAGSIIRAQNL